LYKSGHSGEIIASTHCIACIVSSEHFE
jgi:hypothetical protein